GHRPQVLQHRYRAAELATAAADADVEAPREHEVRPPERDARDEHDGECGDGLAQTDTAEQDVEPLRAEDERTVRVRRDRRQDREPPPGPSPAPALERALEREVRERAREEEQGVHAPVDAVEEERPAPGGERRGGGTRGPSPE